MSLNRSKLIRSLSLFSSGLFSPLYRMAILLDKRDAQIVRLKNQLKTVNHPPPVVSPAKSRSKPPTGRRRGIPDFDSTLHSPKRDMLNCFGCEEEDIFIKPPSMRKRRRHEMEMIGKNEDKQKVSPEWETAPLSWIMHILTPTMKNVAEIGPQVFLDIASQQMNLVIDCLDTQLLGKSSGTSMVLMKQQKSAFLYHATVARILLKHGLDRATEIHQRILKAKITNEISIICDQCNELKSAVAYGERASHLWKSLGLHVRCSSQQCHVLAMLCEMNDIDKAEVMAHRIASNKLTKDTIAVEAMGYLNTIRAAMKQNMKLKVNRSNGWPFACELSQ
jgi:hypothetical protein